MASPNNTAGGADLFDRNYNTAVKNIVLAKQVIKDAVLVESSSSAIETFYQESTTELVGNSEIPRDAEFHADQVIFDVLNVRPKKYGIESRIAWEDTIVSNPNLPQRTTIRIGNRVARLVDTAIWNAMTQNQSATTINSLATAATWNNATRANRIPHEDIAEAIATVNAPVLQAYMPDTLFLSPLDYCFVRTNDYVMSSFDSSAPNLMERGVMGNLLGLSVIVNPVVTADYAVVADAKKAVTVKEVAGLTTEVKRDPGISMTLRAWEYLGIALTDPKAVCLITNTQA